jgi:regulator of nucleoside diphosphate kinase
MTTNPPIYICQSDAEHLNRLLNSPDVLRGTDQTVPERLRDELARAIIVSDSELPPTVIALNSTVELENATDGEIDQYTLVLPEQADVETGRISILAPLGAGMIGFTAGDTFEWATPAGTATFRVRQVTKGAPPAKTEVPGPLPYEAAQTARRT